MFGQRTTTKKQLNSTKKFVPHKYQLKAIKFAVSRPSCGLFMTPGLGKTVCTLSALKILKSKKLVKKILVVAKLRICYSVWPKEIVKWNMPFTFNNLHDSGQYFTSDAEVDIVNYEGLRKFCDKKTFKRKNKDTGQVKEVTKYIPKKEFKNLYDAVIFDESSKLKNTGTQRWKMVKQLIQYIDRRILLTGSPAPNGLIDLFGQVYVIDNGASFTEFITHFRNNYFFPSGYMGHQWKLQPGMEEEIYRKIKPYVIRFGDDEIDLPPLIPVVNPIKLSAEAFAIYKELETNFIVDVKEGLITASTAGVASGKLRQVTGGACYTGKGKNRKTIPIHEEKLEECIEIIEELQGSPCIIGYEFDHEKERLLKAFPEAVHFESGKKGSDIEDRWNRGEITILLGQTSSIAHGINLQDSGYTIILYTIPWNLEDYEQIIRRLWRQGQKNKVYVHHLVAANTVDEDVLMVLDGKDKTQKHFLDAMSDRLKTNMKKEAPVDDTEIITRAIPNPPHNVYMRDDITMFMSGMFECIGGWMPDRHQQFIKNCGGKVSKDETLKSLMNKTKASMLKLFKAKKEGDMYVATNEELFNQLKQYYTEVNAMSAEAQSKFAGKSSKKRISKKVPAKKRAEVADEVEDKPITRKRAVTKKKVPVKKKVAAKKAAPKKKADTGKGQENPKVMLTDESKDSGIHGQIAKAIGKNGIKLQTLMNKLDKSIGSSKVRSYVIGGERKGYYELS